MTDRPDHDAPTSDEAFPRGSEAETTELIRQALEARDYADALERPGSEIGPYKLIAKLGEGGFGAVWLAERRRPFVQRVALKLVKPGMDSRSVVARFEQERQALAVMNHPNIAKVLDGGLTPQGRPYFAMEFVKGEPITAFCDARKLSVRQRLELFAQACDAVQHAHLKGIVHRDIKPSNILAFEVEGEGLRLKVIDFGIAKAMSQTLTDKTIFTETGQMIGTPEYMSPEQADPTASDIDTRSDIYSLGVLLYELMTGATPFDGRALRSKAYAEIQRIIREEDPPTPSARLSTMSTKDSELAERIERSRGVALRELARELRSELEWIPLKAMRKEPQNRYQSASEFASDVRNYLEGKPILAAPASRRYRLRRVLRRHRLAVAVASVVVLLVLIGGALVGWQWRRAVKAEVAAQRDRDAAVSAAAEEAKQRFALEETQRSLERSRGEWQRAVRRGEWSNLIAAFDLGMYGVLQSRLEQIDVSERGWAWAHMHAAIHPELAVLRPPSSIFDPSLPDGDISYRVTPVQQVAFSPEGSELIGVYQNGVVVWDAIRGSVVHSFRNPIPTMSSWLDDGGRYVVFVGLDGEFSVWSLETPKEVLTGRFGNSRPNDGDPPVIRHVAFSPVAARLVLGGDEALEIWAIDSGQLELTVRLGARDMDRELRTALQQNLNSIGWSEDGSQLVAATTDGFARVWESSAGGQIVEYEVPARPAGSDWAGSPSALCAAVSTGLGLTAVVDSYGVLRILSSETGDVVRTYSDLGWAHTVKFDPAGDRVIVESIDQVQACSISTWAMRELIGQRGSGERCMSFSSAGSRVGFVENGFMVQSEEREAGRQPTFLRFPSPVRAVAISPNGTRVAVGQDCDLRLCVTLRPAGVGIDTDRLERQHAAADRSLFYEFESRLYGYGRRREVSPPDPSVTETSVRDTIKPALHDASNRRLVPDDAEICGQSGGARWLLAKGERWWVVDIGTQVLLEGDVTAGGRGRELRFSSDGRWVIGDGEIWKVADTVDHKKFLDDPGVVLDVSASPDGNTLAVVCSNKFDAPGQAWRYPPTLELFEASSMASFGEAIKDVVTWPAGSDEDNRVRRMITDHSIGYLVDEGLLVIRGYRGSAELYEEIIIDPIPVRVRFAEAHFKQAGVDFDFAKQYLLEVRGVEKPTWLSDPTQSGWRPDFSKPPW